MEAMTKMFYEIYTIGPDLSLGNDKVNWGMVTFSPDPDDDVIFCLLADLPDEDKAWIVPVQNIFPNCQIVAEKDKFGIALGDGDFLSFGDQGDLNFAYTEAIEIGIFDGDYVPLPPVVAN